MSKVENKGEKQTITKNDLDVAKLFKELPAIPAPVDEDAIFDQMTTSGKWLPRLQLHGSRSGLVTRKKLTAGDWCVHKKSDEYQMLGQSVICFVADVQPKATDLSDVENIKVSRDPASELFKAIQAGAAQEGDDKMGYLWGPEFLVWIPAMEGDGKFATYHAASISARRSARMLKPLMRNKARFTHELVDGKWVYEVPVFGSYNGDMPAFTMEQFQEAYDIFRNKVAPPKAEESAVVAVESEARPR